MCLIVPTAARAMGNHTAVKGGTIELYCDVSGTPPPTVVWTHVKSGKTWNQKKLTIGNIQEDKLGEYRCNANNKCGGDIKSTFILYEGGWVKLIWEMLLLQNAKKLSAGIGGLLAVFSLILSMTGKVKFQTGKAILLPVEFSRIPTVLNGNKRY